MVEISAELLSSRYSILILISMLWACLQIFDLWNITPQGGSRGDLIMT